MLTRLSVGMYTTYVAGFVDPEQAVSGKELPTHYVA
jgi:hypothetical protein